MCGETKLTKNDPKTSSITIPGAQIFAVSDTVDIQALDNPAQTMSEMTKYAEEALGSLGMLDLETRGEAFEKGMPDVLSRLQKLNTAIDFLRNPASSGQLSGDVKSFEVEVVSGLRAFQAFLSYDERKLGATDWLAMSRSIGQLTVELRDFIEQFTD